MVNPTVDRKVLALQGRALTEYLQTLHTATLDDLEGELSALLHTCSHFATGRVKQSLYAVRAVRSDRRSKRRR